MRKQVLSALALVAAFPALADEAKLFEEARQVAGAIPPKLLEVVKMEINKNGAEGAISACRDKAPAMAKEASEKTGWAIRRVSLKNRNPKAVPDAWEKAVLEDFDRRAAAGEPPAKLEKGELVSDGAAKTYRYMKALPTQEACLQCHGTDLKPEVQAKLKELYPEDKATGYQAPQIRGAITIKKAL
jgi:hypothetical protein